jgi:hypothetical protein
MPIMSFFEVVMFWVFLAMLSVCCVAGYLRMMRPRTSMLDEHFAELEQRRQPRP